MYTIKEGVILCNSGGQLYKEFGCDYANITKPNRVTAAVTTSSTDTSSTSTSTSACARTEENKGQNTSSSGDCEDSLKIYDLSTRKINERRRQVFLDSNCSSCKTEYTSEEKAEAQTNQQQKSDDSNKTKNTQSTYVETYKRISNTGNIGLPTAAKSENVTSYSCKYATIPINKATTTKSPSSPSPPKPPLSRTRSVGIGDKQSPLTRNSVTATSANTEVKAANNQPNQESIKPITNLASGSTALNDPYKANAGRVEKMPQEPANALLKTPNHLQNGSPDTNSLSKGISIKHYERLIEELKCPGCAYPMKPPIYICKTGHSACEQCTRVLLLCPLCRETFTNIRSLTVEALCSKAHFKCSNAVGGCTVRLQIDLISWHEKQCIYKPMKCFMGRVWGDCQWTGREAFWKDHLDADHFSKVFKSNSADLIWNMDVKQKPLTGYYVFEAYNEMFNFYEIYDKERVLFTMTCTSTQREKKHQFAYEVSIIHQENEALAIIQKFPVHSEYDADILAEGTCVSIWLNDLAKFINDEKLLHYRVKVLEVKTPRRSQVLRNVSPSSLPINYQQTQIQGVNLKNVPTHVIVTRNSNNLPYTDNIINGMAPDNDLNKIKREYHEKMTAKKRDSGSDTDPEFEALMAKKWGTPQLNFNRKYLKVNSSSDSSSNEGSNGLKKTSKTMASDRISLASTNTSYKKKMTNTLRKSFRSLKTDISEMKPFGKKTTSPEKQKLEK